MWAQSSIVVQTAGRGMIDIGREINGQVRASGIRIGLCHLFIQHTSASLVICENADPQVKLDLEAFMQRSVPDGDPLFQHDEEGPDDMPAHVRSLLTQSSLGIPIRDGRLDLGTWQGIYLWEHRLRGHERRIT